MSRFNLTIRAGDTQAVEATLHDKDGTVDLTDASAVVLIYREVGASGDATVATLSVEDAPNGRIQWEPDGSEPSGSYDAYVRVTRSDGKTERYPSAATGTGHRITIVSSLPKDES